jgi:thiamine pyrophosphokinase
MKRAIIFANGIMERSQRITSEITTSDLIIAADGGCLHCKALGLIPNVIIGDFDSLSAGEIADYQQADSKLIRYPSHKDETDLELALLYANEQDVEEVLIFGALGARWDMTLANLLLPTQPVFNNINVRLLDGTQELTLLRGGETLFLDGQPGDRVSLIPLSGDASGITTIGLEYPLDNENLLLGSPRGVSNVLRNERAQIVLKDGNLMCILNRENDQQA